MLKKLNLNDGLTAVFTGTFGAAAGMVCSLGIVLLVQALSVKPIEESESQAFIFLVGASLFAAASLGLITVLHRNGVAVTTAILGFNLTFVGYVIMGTQHPATAEMYRVILITYAVFAGVLFLISITRGWKLCKGPRPGQIID